MNGAFVHLAVNHVPVVGMPFAFLLLAGGIFRKSRDLAGAGFFALILIALLTVVAFKSGGPAARRVHAIPGVAGSQIREHAEAADGAMWAAGILGIMGVMGVVFLNLSDGIPRKWTGLSLVGALIASGWLGWVAHLGGLIRHPEIEESFQPPTEQPATPAHSPTSKHN